MHTNSAANHDAAKHSAVLNVAMFQRNMICYSMAAMPISYGAMVMAGSAVHVYQVPPEVANTAVSALLLIISVVVSYFAFRLTYEIYGSLPAVVAVLFVMWPCVGEIATLVLNGYAIEFLRRNGIKVGFFGATKEQLGKLIDSANTGESSAGPTT